MPLSHSDTTINYVSVILKQKETLEVFETLLSQLKGPNQGQTSCKESRISPQFQKYQYLKIEKCVVRFFLLFASSGIYFQFSYITAK